MITGVGVAGVGPLQELKMNNAEAKNNIRFINDSSLNDFTGRILSKKDN